MAVKRIVSKDARICAGLSYVLIGIIWFFVDEKMRNDGFVLFHVKQGLVFLITGFAVSILNSVLWIIPFIGISLIALLQLCLFGLFVFGIVQVLNGQKKELPLVGEYAKHFTFE